MSWHAVDTAGLDLATGRPPDREGAPSAAAAVAAAPVVAWPLQVVGDDGRTAGIAQTLGPGGDRVERLLSALVSPVPAPSWPRVVELAAATPAGPCDLPLAVVSLVDAAAAAAATDRTWLAAVSERRSSARAALVEAGRAEQLEAALHVTMLLAVERLPAIEGGADVRAASGAQLWLLGGTVAAALAGGEHHAAFAPWAELLARGLWPIGPVSPALSGRSGPGDGRLVVGRADGAPQPWRSLV